MITFHEIFGQNFPISVPAKLFLEGLTIEAVTDVPLVLHGGSGLGGDLRRKLALGSHICKFNIGTELRQTFGAALRDTLAQHPQSFDRIEILSATQGPMAEKARAIIAGLKA
jgi:fructose-bisphosphate aldolase class II